MAVTIPALAVVELDDRERPVRVRTNSGRAPRTGDVVTSTTGRVSAVVRDEVLRLRWADGDWSCIEVWHVRG